MNVIQAAAGIVKADSDQQRVIVHEVKYALLGAFLLIIFLIPWSSSLIASVFPACRGPMVVVYKAVLFVAIYYIIQKTDWFQEL
jgi:hypothetical protein